MGGKKKDPPNQRHSIGKEKKKRKTIRKNYARPGMKIGEEINDPQFQWDEDQDFVVERIIGEQTWDGKKYYLVKWQGFDIMMSTWQEAGKIKNMSDLIQEFNRTQKGKRARNVKEDSDKMMNPYRATQTHGHFLYGDEPRQIVNTFVQFDEDGRKTIFVEVAWKYRNTPLGQISLQNSILEADLVFEHDPKFLLDFYESSIVLKVREE